jgi:predicted Zn-dependent protease
MIFGANPRLGFFQGAAFMHPDLRFRFDFPTGWNTQNQATAVVGVSPQQDAIVVLTIAGSAAPSTLLSQFLGGQGMQARGTSTSPINGLPAASGAFTVQTQEGSLAGWVAFVSHGGSTYRLLGYTPLQRINAYDAILRQSVGSFRVLTDQSALSVKPARVRLVTVPRAMTIEEFNRTHPSTIPLQQLALINGVQSNARLPVGTVLKVVVTD